MMKAAASIWITILLSISIKFWRKNVLQLLYFVQNLKSPNQVEKKKLVGNTTQSSCSSHDADKLQQKREK